MDHINGIRTDNSFKNLRCVTRSENLKNSSVRSDNKSGTVGVSWAKEKGKWCVRIGTDDGYKNLGYFKDKDLAIKKRKEAEITYGYHKNHGKNPSIQP